MKKFNVAIVVVLIVSLWVNFSLINKIEYLTNEVSNIKYNMQNSLSNMSGSMNNFISSLKKQSLWISSRSLEIISVNESLNEFNANLSFTLNELKSNEKLYIVILNQSDGSEQKVEVPKKDSLNYSLNLKLKDSNFKLNLLGVNENVSRTEFLDSVNLTEVKNSLVGIDGDKLKSVIKYKESTISVDFFLSISNKPRKYIKGMDNLLLDIDFSSIKADICIGMEKIGEIDFLNNTGYESKDINTISNKIPEYSEYATKYNQIYGKDYKSELHAGTFKVSGDDFTRLMEMDMADENLYLLIKVKDKNGNEFQYVLGSHFYEIVNNKVVKYM